MSSQSYAEVMVIPSAPERVENSVPSQTTQTTYVSLLDQGPFAKLRFDRLFRSPTTPPIAAQATPNNTPITENPAVSTNLTQKMICQVSKYAENYPERIARPYLVLYEVCKTVPPQCKASINPKALQKPSTGPPIESSTQTIASNTPVDFDTMWEGGPLNQEPIL